MKKVVIVSAVRTPIGRFGGCLKSVKVTDLLIHVMKAAVERANIKPAVLDQIIVGNIFGHLEQNVSRLAVLTWGLPDFKDPPYDIPGFTVDCACTSASQAIILGANAIRAGQADIVMAGGVESMSNAPYILDNCRWGKRLRHEVAIDSIWGGMQEYPIGGGMGLAAERLADMYKISREELDELALSSHQRACAAIREGRFDKEIAPFEVSLSKGKKNLVRTDEGPREDTTLEKLSKLPPAFKEGGVVTAGNASQMNDGAALVILMSEEKAGELGLKSMGEVKAYRFVATDPLLVGIAPVPAIKSVLEETRLKLEDIQIFEINEAFASYYIATERELGLNREITNVSGSGISLGHPVGATGTRMVVTMVHEMERRGLNFGISALCGGSGVGTAILVKR